MSTAKLMVPCVEHRIARHRYMYRCMDAIRFILLSQRALLKAEATERVHLQDAESVRRDTGGAVAVAG